MVRQNHWLRKTSTARRAGHHHRDERSGDGVVFLGDSAELLAVYDWACGRGFVPVDLPHPDLMCAVVDEDILDGLCTSAEADIVQRVRDSGLPCVPPSQASAWLGARRCVSYGDAVGR
ncbi:hypothetical protein [Haloechinothrix salitolerans]|uniref:Uncharacterized protein n=1 Tax=Haloechinothrix salitolerans TaxID=926830 RepID=A0ABW2C2H9_9PSEU